MLKIYTSSRPLHIWRLLNWYKYNHWFQARLYRLQAKVILRICWRKLLSTRFPSTQSLQTSWWGSIRVSVNLYAGCSDIFWKLYTLDLTWAIEHQMHIFEGPIYGKLDWLTSFPEGSRILQCFLYECHHTSWLVTNMQPESRNHRTIDQSQQSGNSATRGRLPANSS